MFGLSTQADDRGRFDDKPAQLNGFLWAMRGNHSTEQLEAELQELEKEDIICRYTGCNGRRYIHLVRWDDHQSINRPSPSRIPRCPRHPVSTGGVTESCIHPGECSVTPHAHLSEPSTLDLGSRNLDRGSRTVDLGEGHAQARAKPPQPRATRIPEDFAVTPELATWAAAETPRVDTRLETAKFIDYWRSAAGQRATKRDWPATWRNWMRRAAGDQPARASPRSQSAELFADARAREHAQPSHQPIGELA